MVFSLQAFFSFRYSELVLRAKKTRPTREEGRAHTREKLLASAREVFAKNGYPGTSVDLIAERAGFSKGAFYSNFESKEAIFLALLEQHKGEQIAALDGLLLSSETVDRFFELIGDYYSRLEDDLEWGLLSAEFQIQAGRDSEFAKHWKKSYRRQRALCQNLINQLFAWEGRKPPASTDELAGIF
ncbi:MAG: TetR/AcrR family transcriptional regulator, partial [Blastocatellia bacterium]